MRVLVTGASGFAGRHLVRLCAAEGAETIGLGRSGPPDVEGLGWIEADLRDERSAARAVHEAAPERVFHLAADASVAASWESPRATFENNLFSTLNVLEAVRTLAPDARVLVAGSGEIYGPAAPERLPV